VSQPPISDAEERTTTVKTIFRLTEESGTAWSPETERVEIGSGQGCGVFFDPELFPMVSERHAYLACQYGLYMLYDNQSAQGTYVNGVRTSLARLRSGDFIQIGRDGPKLQFEGEASVDDRWKAIPGKCRLSAGMLRSMVTDSIQSTKIDGVRKRAKPARFLRELLERAKRQHLIRALVIVILASVLFAVTVAGALLWAGFYVRELGERTVRLEEAIQRERDLLLQIEALTTQLEAEKAAVTKNVGAMEATIKRLREDLAKSVEERRRDFVAVVERNQKAVVLVRHSYQVINAETGRVVRVVGSDPMGNPVLSDSAEEGGFPLILNIQGTAFAVDAKGTLLTNRHVVEPWAENEILKRRGWSGKTVGLTATFADTADLIPARVLKVSKEVDAASLRVEPYPGMPVVQGIDADPKNLRQGQQIAILGFPIQAVSDEGRTLTSLTMGVLSKVGLAEQLLFDAPVDPGNSGGPIINQRGMVIGIVYGVGLDPQGRRLHGANYGIPIRFALGLLEGRKKEPVPRS
jgi:S1-C subfamily serine protease